ncbi:hypothetical protein PG999_007742, partial [Apiospora kogelbergensis]
TYAEGCSKDNPCAVGCCSKFGFCGLGQDCKNGIPYFMRVTLTFTLLVCAKDVCVDTCDRKGDCNPGGWDKQYFSKEKCPLNVCCSAFGFCGTTEEFCKGKEVKRPSYEAKGQGFSRIVGYYESWSPSRPCNQFYPEQIPKGIYTHLNFAFATIDPVSYEVKLAAPADEDLLRRLAARRDADPGLSVFIALGGWTFNDPGPTATTFSDIAASQGNTKKFTDSLISFLTTYDLQGVDIDWEYPEADDRSGRPEDYENVVTFLKRVKSALKGTGGRDGLSITLPASFWYLQHFDIAKIQDIVDFFNIMSYDFHGTWDMQNKWVGAYLNPHTNLTEIQDGLDLLWRNGVKEEKVVLGMAFYGRAFTLADPGCTSPGCVYASGGNKQSCSHEISVVLNSEIVDIQKRTGAKSVLLKDAAVKQMVYDSDQWVTYDDEDTFQLRADFARRQGLGGLMVWAVSHDTADATFNMALAKAANKKFQKLEATSDGTQTDVTYHKQCKWTNCNQECPAGYKRMKREDGGARSGEYMVDQEGCTSGIHQLCCPEDEKLPSCGWYTHNNGKCDSKCPVGKLEVGSNSKYCRSGYQAACCGDTPDSMALYLMCGWSTAFPKCNDDDCSKSPPWSNEIARSNSGSGGAQCKSKQERKYCCRGDYPGKSWDNCEWRDNLGIQVLTKGSSGGVCMPNCKEDEVRVSMDHQGCSQGAKARCCTPKFKTETKRNTAENDEWKTLLSKFLDNTTCTDDQHSEKYRNEQTLITYINELVYKTPDAKRKEIWNAQIGPKYSNLKYDSLTKWTKTDASAQALGALRLPRDILCNLQLYENQIGGKGTDCKCAGVSCSNIGPRGDSDFGDAF